MKGKYYKTKATVEAYINMAKDVHSKPLIEKLEKILTSKSKLLEIGSGPGTDWRILNELYQVTGSDNSNEFLKHLVANNPKGEFRKLDAISLKTDLIFDGIYSNKVLHHLKDKELIASVNRQNEILHSHGIICHSFWKGEGTEIFNGLFVNYHSEETLRNVFQEFFEIISIENYNEFDENDSLLLMAKKKY